MCQKKAGIFYFLLQWQKVVYVCYLLICYVLYIFSSNYFQTLKFQITSKATDFCTLTQHKKLKIFRAFKASTV